MPAMMQEIVVDVDFNGIILFNYPEILDLFGGHIQDGQNILDDFTKTEKGNIVLDKGIALPILGMDDGGYILRLFIDEIPDDHNREIIFRDEFFYMNVTSKLYVADIAVFWEWEDFSGWEETSVPRGIYEVRVEGVSYLNENNEVEYGYDLTLRSIPKLLKRTVEPRSNSKVYNHGKPFID
jgi:hypothetical protein